MVSEQRGAPLKRAATAMRRLLGLRAAGRHNGLPPRPFSAGTRPVIRWIKGDGKDDVVTRSAIAQATRLFGPDVDYCLCTAEISASRARDVLAWASQPVEWWPVEAADNPGLTAALAAAGCGPEAFGYWWKWLPERVRPGAPEWILDGDMVITGAPAWFDAWRSGRDGLRVTQDDAWDINGLYGEYLPLVDTALRLYSGLISLPPGLRYLPAMLRVMAEQPLAPGHDGRTNMSEQGIVAAAMGRLGATPIPLHEFPFGRAFEANLNHGLKGPVGTPWGYHFGHAFRQANIHYERLAAAGIVDVHDETPPPAQRFRWLRNFGQWGRDGWSMEMTCVERIAALAREHPGAPLLEIGTSRGYLAAVLAASGRRVTTIDHADRGATANLAGLDVEVVVDRAAGFLRRDARSFPLITVDLHGNRVPVWKRLWPLLVRRLAPGGRLVLYNSHLWQMPEWQRETGLQWVMNTKLAGWTVETFATPLPGMIVCRHG